MPSELKARPITQFVWLSRVRIKRPVATSQMRIDRSAPAEASRAPSGLKATAKTASVCPTRTREDIPRGRIPDPDGPVGAGGGQPGTVGAESQRIDRADVTATRADLAAPGRVPESDGPSIALCARELAHRPLDHLGRIAAARRELVVRRVGRPGWRSPRSSRRA